MLHGTSLSLLLVRHGFRLFLYYLRRSMSTCWHQAIISCGVAVGHGVRCTERRAQTAGARRGRGLEGAYPSPGRGGRKSHLKQGHAHRSKESLARVKSRVLNLTRQALRDLFFSFLSFSVVRIKYGTHLDAHHTHTLYRRTTTQPTGMLTRNTQFWLRRARESGCSWGLRCPPGGACRTYPYRRPRRGSGWSLARWRA